MRNEQFSARVLAWFAREGRQDLPWQHTGDPYAVWVSEIMLQQTQVTTVIPYFERFMASFPDVVALADAGEDEVLRHWSGLGYYARARNLHKSARMIRDEHDGSFPTDFESVLALPGIGRSTAGAILAIARGQRHAILDGNVKRVLARHAAIDGWPGSTAVSKALWSLAEAYTPQSRVNDYTQAIMDLGATLCTRTKPACEACPVNETCKAYDSGTVEQFPAKRPALKISKKSFQMFILLDKDGKVLLERRPPAGIWGGLWSLPADDDGTPIQQRLGIDSHPLKPLAPMQHQLTHIKMTIQPLIGHTEMFPSGVECTSDQRWFSRQEWPELGLPRPVRQLLETHLENIEK